MSNQESLSTTTRVGRWLTMPRFVAILSLLMSLSWIGWVSVLGLSSRDMMREMFMEVQFMERGSRAYRYGGSPSDGLPIALTLRWAQNALAGALLVASIGLLYYRAWAIRIAFVAAAIQVGLALLMISLTFSELLRGFTNMDPIIFLGSDRVIFCGVLLVFLCMPSFRKPFDEAKLAEEEAEFGGGDSSGPAAGLA